MSNIPNTIILTQKMQLTHDVYELSYSSDFAYNIKPWQFLLCDTASDTSLRRAYSVSSYENNQISFIVKKLEHGKWGSRALCDQKIGHAMQVSWPLGSFIVRENSFPKVFIGTGTGFAPLYFMIKHSMSKMNNEQWILNNGELFFLFGVRELRDVFYQEVLEKWREGGGFDYEICCSREGWEEEQEQEQGRNIWFSGREKVQEQEQEQGRNIWLPEKHHHGRVTDYLTSDTISRLNTGSETEFYICGSPAMVREVRNILKENWIIDERVFFEQY